MRDVTTAILGAALLVTGCQTVSYQGNENSPYYVVPAGSRLVLEHELTIPGNRAAVYIQGGQLSSYWNVNPYYPYCKFELRAPGDTAQKVQPGEFIVTRAYQETPLTVRNAPQRFDGAVRLVRVSAEDSEGVSATVFATTMRLRSERQPQVSRMTCAQWGYPPQDGHLSIAEIRKTLAGLFTLRLAR
jgi:hypothetical protein